MNSLDDYLTRKELDGCLLAGTSLARETGEAPTQCGVGTGEWAGEGIPGAAGEPGLVCVCMQGSWVCPAHCHP